MALIPFVPLFACACTHKAVSELMGSVDSVSSLFVSKILFFLFHFDKNKKYTFREYRSIMRFYGSWPFDRFDLFNKLKYIICSIIIVRVFYFTNDNLKITVNNYR